MISRRVDKSRNRIRSVVIIAGVGPHQESGNIYKISPKVRERDRDLESADRTDSSGEVFVIAVLAAGIPEIDMRRHVGGLLRGRPVGEVVGHTVHSEGARSGKCQVM